MGRIEFYALPGCPYCMRVERQLKKLGVTYERHDVPPDRNDRSRLTQLTGQSDVPVIVDRAHGIEWMYGSGQIIEYLRTTYANGH